MLGQVQRPLIYEALSHLLPTVDSELAYNSRSLDLHTSSLGFFSFYLSSAFRVKEVQASILYIRETGFVLGNC